MLTTNGPPTNRIPVQEHGWIFFRIAMDICFCSIERSNNRQHDVVVVIGSQMDVVGPTQLLLITMYDKISR